MKRLALSVLLAALCLVPLPVLAGNYALPDTGQERCFGDRGQVRCPGPGQAYFGQDGQYQRTPMRFKDNGDGTVSDLVTGLMWQKTPDYAHRTWDEAKAYAESLALAGHSDWRLPSIKELLSIVYFSGNVMSQTPYIDTRYFDFKYPDTSQGFRGIDAQYWSSTVYIGATMFGDRSAFGYNFADGRIKSYPMERPGGPPGGMQGGQMGGPMGGQMGGQGQGGHTQRSPAAPQGNEVRAVRGPAYGINDFADNGDGTVTDRATGLTWTQRDAGRAMPWKDALAYCENLSQAGTNDWRLPDIKELQSIADYSRAPDAGNPAQRGPAIDPVFSLSDNEAWCWSSTTHIEGQGGYYLAFGRAMSAWKDRSGRQMNAHGAGALRSDPKSGDPSRYASGHGPQGDEIRINNHVLCVRGGGAQVVAGSNAALPALTTNAMGFPMGGGQGNRKGGQMPGGGMGQGQMPGGGMGQGQMPGGGAGWVQRLDRDGDGKVSASEFDGPAQGFTRFDRNRDGYISADEAPSGPPPGRQ